MSADRRCFFGVPAKSRWLFLKGHSPHHLPERALELCDASFLGVRITAAAQCAFTILVPLMLPTVNQFGMNAVLKSGLRYAAACVDLPQDL
jgi:hypothetical protein